ncbi:signal peptidase I [Arenicella xantha]|uniref:Signal peptidase I n=1 Tax=Arenicella xantha TaxID=644221 RepID=A0A395JFZ5_9GAMM|nr:signal peptidase I [Arenicella xantha]RBP48341.1 signal peptidase I [Arenicella xantha]
MHQHLRALIRENRGILLFLVLMLVFRSSLADWNVVPTGSMQPTIVEGDRILINKLAYDLQLPFSNIKLLKFGDPERGDIIIFNSEVADLRLVKRVIGLPGDSIEMRNNSLLINGQQLDYTALKLSPDLNHESEHQNFDLREDLLGLPHKIRTTSPQSPLASFGPVIVPENNYLALGDSRDNSADSRVIGFIPRSEIIGRSRRVVMSLDSEHYYMPRQDRFWKTL